MGGRLSLAIAVAISCALVALAIVVFGRAGELVQYHLTTSDGPCRVGAR